MYLGLAKIEICFLSLLTEQGIERPFCWHTAHRSEDQTLFKSHKSVIYSFIIKKLLQFVTFSRFHTPENEQKKYIIQTLLLMTCRCQYLINILEVVSLTFILYPVLFHILTNILILLWQIVERTDGKRVRRSSWYVKKILISRTHEEKNIVVWAAVWWINDRHWIPDIIS